jgi:Protein of unknown function (DUF3122)
MSTPQLVRIFRFILIGLLILGILLWATPTAESADGAVVQREEASQQLLYRSQQHLSDRVGNTWQVIFFKQVQQNQPPLVSLRLAGLPGAAEVNHPLPLTITTASGQTLSAADVFFSEAPAPTIAQYDMRELIVHLSAEPLRLTIPVLDQIAIDLDVPSTVVEEWIEVITR